MAATDESMPPDIATAILTPFESRFVLIALDLSHHLDEELHNPHCASTEAAGTALALLLLVAVAVVDT